MDHDERHGSGRHRELHVVAHTHWDREWYHQAARFRQRLVALVDALLDAPEQSAPFLLDGQAIVVADYLAVRPDRRSLLVSRLRDGSLEAGPWFVLADNLIPSGESILRNLQAGRRYLASIGAPVVPVAWCPDSFGHPAAIPMIAQGFGLNSVIVWRGLGGAQHPSGDTMWWQSPDGSRVLTWHLPRDGYEFGSALPLERDAAAARWAGIREELLSRAATSVTVLPNGADHHALQTRLGHAIELLQQAANAHGDDVRIVRSSLATFAEALESDATRVSLAEIAGELRDSYGYTWALQGTFGTRAADKRRNARLERLLLHDVEPWCALVQLTGVRAVNRSVQVKRRSNTVEAISSAAPSTQPDGSITPALLNPLLAHAWETLLRTHPHDTLCGCSIDDVALAMRARQRSVLAQARGLRDDALHLLLQHDSVSARSRPIEHGMTERIVVRNRAARVRSGVARVQFHETLADVGVGPGSAREIAGPLPPSAPLAFGSLIVQERDVSLQHVRRESPQHYPDNDLVRVHDAFVYLPAAPACGLRVFQRNKHEAAEQPAHPVTLTSSGDMLQLGNGLVEVHVSMDGVTLRAGERTITRFISIESQDDLGDTYTSSLRNAPVELELRSISRGFAGPLHGSIDLLYAHSEPNAVRVRVSLSLDADAEHLRVEVRGENRRKDHRLRIRFVTGIDSPRVYADAAFGPVPRAPIVVPPHVNAPEMPPLTMPLHRWVSVSNDAKGVAIISDGLAEAEAGDGFVAITLLRAIGELSRNDLPERPGHAGWPAPVPDAQSLGSFVARFGIVLHDSWNVQSIDRIERAADDLLLPLVGDSWRDLEKEISEIEGPELHGAGLRLQSFMPAQDGEGAVARIVNCAEQHTNGVLRLPRNPLEICTARLDETPLDDWTKAPGDYSFSLHPRGVLTLRLRARP